MDKTVKLVDIISFVDDESSNRLAESVRAIDWEARVFPSDRWLHEFRLKPTALLYPLIFLIEDVTPQLETFVASLPADIQSSLLVNLNSSLELSYSILKIVDDFITAPFAGFELKLRLEKLSLAEFEQHGHCLLRR